MSALRTFIVVGILLLGCGFADELLGQYIGPLEYIGYLVFDYPEGNNPMINIAFTVDPTIAGNLIIVNVPSPWSYSYSGGTLVLSGGSLNPGGRVGVTVSLDKYFEDGEYPVTSVGSTSAGEVSNAIGPLLVGELYLLRVIYLANTYLLPLVTLVLGLIFLELWLWNRERSLDKMADIARAEDEFILDTELAIMPLTARGVIDLSMLPEDCQKLVDKCKKAQADAKAAEAEAKAAKQKADSANLENEKAKKAVQGAQANLRDAQKKPKDESKSWVEIDGRRITSMDLKLRKAESKALWDSYRRGDIDAETLENAWEELGEDGALEELRKKDWDARKKAAEKALEKAKNQAKGAAETARKAKADAEFAKENAAEMKALADKICKLADECVKAHASAPKPSTTGKEDEKSETKDEKAEETTEETTWTTEETTGTTETDEYTTDTYEEPIDTMEEPARPTRTTEETTTETIEEKEEDKEKPKETTKIFGPRLGESEPKPKTPEKPSEKTHSPETDSKEKSKIQKSNLDETKINPKTLNEKSTQSRQEYRSTSGGAWKDFWGTRNSPDTTPDRDLSGKK